MEIEKNEKRIERIKLLMKALNLTQVTMSKDIGIQQSHISRYLTGALEISNGFCYQLILKYGINPQWLEYGRGEMFASASGRGDDEIVMGLNSYMHMSEDLATFRTIIADQRKRIKQLEKSLKNNEYVVTRDNVPEENV